MSLLKFITRRLLHVIPTLLGLATLVFFLSRLLPGDPASLYVTPGVPARVAEELRTQFGLGRPLWDQYLAWLSSTLRGELGYSFAHGAPVRDVLMRVFPNTLLLGGAALILECALAFFVAALAARAIGSRFDRSLSALMLVTYALPSFWIGILLLTSLSYWLGVFPPSQMHSVGGDTPGGIAGLWDLLKHLALPALTVAVPGIAALARYLRTGIAEAMQQDHVIAATAMGLPAGKVFRSYVFPNAVGPVISVVGLEIGVLLTGVLVTETLFAWPGMGRLAVMAIFSRDYPLILGCTLSGGVIVVAANLLADLLRAWIDPRIRLS